MSKSPPSSDDETIASEAESSSRPRRSRILPKAPRSKLRKRARRPELHIDQILKWADMHFQRIGRWPNENAGRIAESADDTWMSIDHALRNGGRGLPRNSGLTLPRLLEKHRGVRNIHNLPRLSISKI